MKSQYPIVNTILKQINEQASTSKDIDMWDIIHDIACENGEFAYGSSRAVIILPDDKIVIKVPYTTAGYMQNQIEYDYSNLEYCTDVLECHDFAGQDNYIIVCPYYQPILERYDELTSDILSLNGTVSDVMNVYTDNYIDTHFKHIDILLVNHLMIELSKMDMDLSTQDAIYDLNFEKVGRTIFDLFDEYELEWYDHNIENFGINDEKNVIMLDNGLQTYDDLRQNSYDGDYVTYADLIGA